MNERIANLYINALNQLNKQKTVDVFSLPIPPGFEPLNPIFVAEWQKQKKEASPVLKDKSTTSSIISKQKIGNLINVLIIY